MPDALAARPELLLLAAAAGLFLLDTMQFVFSNDIVFVRDRRRRWTALWPERYPQFARRFLLAVRPWQPYCSTLRVSWPAGDVGAERSVQELVADFERRAEGLRPLGWMSLVLLPQIFIGLPALYGLAGPVMFLFGVAAVYLQVVAMIVLLLLARGRLQMPLGASLLIAFEVLICVPYAINAFRRATRRAPAEAVDVLDLGRALLDAEQYTGFRRTLAGNARAQIGWAPEGSPKAAALELLRRRAEAG